MREIAFDRNAAIPVVQASIRGPRGAYKARLVFDTGCGLTQVDTNLLEFIGYSARDGEGVIRIAGVTGESQDGYSVKVAGFSFFGRRFRNVLIGALDFEHLSQQRIDGLLGWDLIKELRLEVDGPNGRLKVFSKKEMD